VTLELIEDLDRYDDAPIAPSDKPLQLAPGWQADNAVLCIAGRGPLDEIVTGMLGQLLRKHGLQARRMPHEMVSRAHIRSFDVRDAAMVCIFYLDIGGKPAHLRYLLRRLRERLQDVPLLVGLWPAQDPILSDSRLRQLLGADYYVSTLREAVQACVAEARGIAAPKPRAGRITRETDETHGAPSAARSAFLRDAAEAAAIGKHGP
jgi:hypothetical protein